MTTCPVENLLLRFAPPVRCFQVLSVRGPSKPVAIITECRKMTDTLRMKSVKKAVDEYGLVVNDVD